MIRSMAATVALALALAWGLAAPSMAQDPQQPPEGQDDEPVQLGTQLVNVPFTVVDKKNKPIVDLKQSDVQVLEDGKPQEVFSFERTVEIPLSIALLIDTSGSQEETIGIEKAAAARFFEQVLRPDRDLASIVSFAKEVTLEQPLTANVAGLQKALHGVRVNPVGYYGTVGTPPASRTAGGTSMYDAIYLAAGDVLRAEAGRRVVILVSDGYDTTSFYKSEAAIERAWRSEAIIYAIGIGVQINGGALEKLAKETGGRYFEPRGHTDLDRAFTEIQNELRQQYVLTYTPANVAQDGSFRRIEVKVVGEGRKDLRVRHRRGYYAPGAPAKR